MHVRTDDVVCQSLDGELVLLDLRSSQYLGINATGAVLFEALQAGVDTDGLVQTLCDEFDVTRERAEQDVRLFLDRLREADLLVEPNRRA